ncbi:MAG: hypothetical protein ABH885_08120, partial [Candidatus Omnitrophota bacterium]
DGVDGFLVSAADEFISRMVELSIDRDKAAEMGLNAARAVDEKYTLNKAGQRLFDILSEVR